MTEDQQLGLILKVAILAALGAFAPQIVRLLRRFGYRESSEVDTTGWRRGLVVAVFSTAAFFLILALSL